MCGYRRRLRPNTHSGWEQQACLGFRYQGWMRLAKRCAGLRQAAVEARQALHQQQQPQQKQLQQGLAATLTNWERRAPLQRPWSTGRDFPGFRCGLGVGRD